MACHPRVFVDLVVVTALESLVTKEVNSTVFDSPRQVLLVLNMLQAIPLIPAGREDVEGDLPADRVSNLR